MPYFYYKFYDEFEKFSAIQEGLNPQFQDVSSFTVIFNSQFHEYIENESLHVYLFDSANPIEVDVEDKDSVKLVNADQQTQQDLIGIAYIPLRALSINGIVQGKFNILNEKGQKAGDLVASIYLEEKELNK